MGSLKNHKNETASWRVALLSGLSGVPWCRNDGQGVCAFDDGLQACPVPTTLIDAIHRCNCDYHFAIGGRYHHCWLKSQRPKCHLVIQAYPVVAQHAHVTKHVRVFVINQRFVKVKRVVASQIKRLLTKLFGYQMQIRPVTRCAL